VRKLGPFTGYKQLTEKSRFGVPAEAERVSK